MSRKMVDKSMKMLSLKFVDSLGQEGVGFSRSTGAAYIMLMRELYWQDSG